MGFTCCVPGCYSSSDDKSLRFHRFPENSELRKEWIIAINRKDPNSAYKLFTPTMKSHRVCSRHFLGGTKTDGSVPSIFTDGEHTIIKATPRRSSSAIEKRKPVEATPTAKRRKSKSGRVAQVTVAQTTAVEPPPTRQPLTTQGIIQALYRSGHIIPDIGACEEVHSSEPPTLTIQTDQPQVCASSKISEHSYSRNIPIPFSPTKYHLKTQLSKTTSSALSMMQSLSSTKAETKALKSRTMDIDTVKKDSSHLNLYTGFKDLSHFNSLVDFLSPDSHHIIYPSGERFTNRLSFENSILLTLAKYKLDTPQEDLAFRLVTHDAIQQNKVLTIKLHIL